MPFVGSPPPFTDNNQSSNLRSFANLIDTHRNALCVSRPGRHPAKPGALSFVEAVLAATTL